jgi:hypothetical protein
MFGAIILRHWFWFFTVLVFASIVALTSLSIRKLRQGNSEQGQNLIVGVDRFQVEGDQINTPHKCADLSEIVYYGLSIPHGLHVLSPHHSVGRQPHILYC